MIGDQLHTRLQEEIRSVIAEWVGEKKSENYWREPLVAVASASDPLFMELRRVVDPEHAMPEDLLPGARAVVVFFLPFQQRLGEENDCFGFHAARSWAEAYVATNQLIQAINTHLNRRLEEAGYRSTVTPATHNFDEEKLVSRWSHKHLAYIAGLGTFGHHHQLITASGCCGRLGSIVTDAPLSPTPRPAAEWCLVKAGRECHACVQKCPCGALSESEFDRKRCYAQCLINDRYYGDLPLVDVCGKCACEAPCSYSTPMSSAKSQRPLAE
jgi:epoxyqueuosine reductase